MIEKIIVSAFLIFLFAALYALSNFAVGRTDKAHSCGLDSCRHCALNPDSCDHECTESAIEKNDNEKTE